MIDSKRRLLAINEQALILVVRNCAELIETVEVERPVYVLGSDEIPVDSGTTTTAPVHRFDPAWLERMDRVELRQEIEAATIGVTPRIDALLARDAANPLRRLAYIEVEKKRAGAAVVFETDCPWSVERLAELSQKAQGAGRSDAVFGSFQWMLIHEGFRCKQVERIDKRGKQRGKVPAGMEEVLGRSVD